MDDERNRLVAAALRYSAATGGGLDSEDAETETANALADLDAAATEYVALIGAPDMTAPEPSEEDGEEPEELDAGDPDVPTGEDLEG